VRTINNYINGYYAAQIKKQMGIPLVVSLHTHPDESERSRVSWLPLWKKRLILELRKTFERETLRNADCVIPVYEPIREYALRYGAKRVEVIYNIINPTHLRRKTCYRLGQPPRIISIGNQMPGKNPDNLIRAVAETEVELTLVGKGEYHEYLKSVAQECGVADQIVFKPAIPNDDLCEMLPEFDIFAAHCDYWGIPKAVMEPLLTGLPVVINRCYPEPVPELNGDWVMAVENTKEGYLDAIKKLFTDDDYRESLGQRGYDYAWKNFAPYEMERKVVDLYKELVPGL
jgi:glycosyltransferase involved in cell wall biosynthesis